MAKPSDKTTFLGAVRAAGGRVTNGNLRTTLGWAEDKYWRVHQELFEAGEIERGRGQGGTVLLISNHDQGLSASDVADCVDAEQGVEIDDPSPEENKHIPELALYEGLKNQLQRHWALRRQLDECHCEIVALQGRRETGGSWSRPDICVIGSRKFEYFPDRVFELHTFEVKAANDVSVKGVLEALAHREASTRAYVLYHTAGQDFFDYPESSRIQEIAGRHGVGVISARNVDDIETWDEIVPAQRAASDPEAMNTFIGRSLSDEAKRKIRKWFSW